MIYIISGLAVLVILSAIAWRLGSRRHKLPCPSCLRWMVELDNPFAKTNQAAFIVDHMELEPGMTVLDGGCGPGRVTIPIAKKVGGRGRVVAMDIQKGMLIRAGKKGKAADVNNIIYLHAGFGEGKLGKENYDRALLVTVLGEIPDRKSALKEIYNALKPGGILTVSELIFDPHFQRKSTVSELTAEIGFQEKSFYGNRLAYQINLQKPSTIEGQTL